MGWGGDPVHSGFLGSDSVFGTPPAPPWHVQEEDGAPPPHPPTHGSERLTHTIFYEEHTRFYCGPNSAPSSQASRTRVGPESDPSRRPLTRTSIQNHLQVFRDDRDDRAPPPLLFQLVRAAQRPSSRTLVLHRFCWMETRLEPREAGLPPVLAPLLSDVSALPVC